ncbi:hypothetical protein CLU79DRAFT_70380 [Phycomyces nitens]|nr:hypothetical protein CLU79DRAFT_70380 [Phycomyces nitens]
MDPFRFLPEEKRRVLMLAWRAMNLGSNVKAGQPSKRDLVNMNIPMLCDTLNTPDARLALRITAQVLVGIAKVLQHQHFCVYEDTVMLWARICRESLFMTMGDIDMPFTTARQSSITFSEKEFGQFEIGYKGPIFNLFSIDDILSHQDKEYGAVDQEVSKAEYYDHQTVTPMNIRMAQEPSRLPDSFESDPFRRDAMEIDTFNQESNSQDYIWQDDSLSEPLINSAIHNTSERPMLLTTDRFSREAADVLTSIRSPISRRRSISIYQCFG